MTANETVKAIAQSAQSCWTCGGAPNPANFGGLCDTCDEKRRVRLAKSRVVLEQYGHTNTQEYKALRHLGY